MCYPALGIHTMFYVSTKHYFSIIGSLIEQAACSLG